MTQPVMLMTRLENAPPIANVAVTKAVLGKTNENQAIEKTIVDFPTAEVCANTAMKKKKIASLR